MADGLGERHLAVCRRFGESVRAANGKWDRRSPCDVWDARGVLEHVIGFHDVLLLRPLGLAARNAWVLKGLERLYIAFLRIRPFLARRFAPT